jgi:hypothetical protein
MKCFVISSEKMMCLIASSEKMKCLIISWACYLNNPVNVIPSDKNEVVLHYFFRNESSTVLFLQKTIKHLVISLSRRAIFFWINNKTLDFFLKEIMRHIVFSAEIRKCADLLPQKSC